MYDFEIKKRRIKSYALSCTIHIAKGLQYDIYDNQLLAFLLIDPNVLAVL